MTESSDRLLVATAADAEALVDEWAGPGLKPHAVAHQDPRTGVVTFHVRGTPTHLGHILAALRATDPTGMQAWMQTFTGRAFYPLAPNVNDVDPVDIAHALSLLCRYGGHVSRFYSVAEHCVLMSYAVAPEHALWALLHDATEAYMGDMIRPLKAAMPAYQAAEDRLMVVICDRFGLDHTCPVEVKEADNRILHDERDALMAPPPLPWAAVEDVPPLGVKVEGWGPAEAERRYLARLHELYGNGGVTDAG
jgi:hypothetical protein